MSARSWTTQDSQTGFRVVIVQLDPKPKPAPEPNPTPLPPGILTNSIGMKLAPIPAGKFVMGSPVDEPWRPWLGRDEIARGGGNSPLIGQTTSPLPATLTAPAVGHCDEEGSELICLLVLLANLRPPGTGKDS